VTEKEFLLELERLLKRTTAYTLEKVYGDGDILLRKTASKANKRARNMAFAIQSIMQNDAKKHGGNGGGGGGGWL
jgi:hypothetical protein